MMVTPVLLNAIFFSIKRNSESLAVRTAPGPR